MAQCIVAFCFIVLVFSAQYISCILEIIVIIGVSKIPAIPAANLTMLYQSSSSSLDALLPTLPITLTPALALAPAEDETNLKQSATNINSLASVPGELVSCMITKSRLDLTTFGIAGDIIMLM
ncbi:hypothetical protein P692DRAFT_201810801 [Suillus brevipes Sb2]|nr:hypothetical protein P692DRAFT_201810801 [Suillus brevipes Sb2]